MIKKTSIVGMLLLGVLSIGAKGCELIVSPPDPCAFGDCGEDTDGKIPPVSCEDFAGMDFGACEMLLGWGVVEGKCQAISGCGAKGYQFWASLEECEIECGDADPVCEDIGNEYQETIASARGCEQHSDCQVLWGQCAEGLGGCYEFVNQSVSQEQLDNIGAKYWDANCAGWVCDCAYIEYFPACVQGQCTGLEEEPVSNCEDVTEMYFGPCDMHLGWAVSKGACQPISGCDAAGFEFFETKEQCQTKCTETGGFLCHDGSALVCDMTPPPCEEGSILAIQDGCYACVNPTTCAPWGEPGCKSDEDCGSGDYCDECGTSSCPFCDDCVAACLPEKPQEPTCYEDADCTLGANYCGGCNCEAYLADSPVEYDCPDEDMVYCFADPCMDKEAICENGKCLVGPLF